MSDSPKVSSLFGVPLASLIVGIIVARYMALSGFFAIPVAISVMLASAVLLWKSYLSRFFFITILFFCTGFITFTIQESHYSSLRSRYADQLITVTGTVTDIQASDEAIFQGIMQLAVTEVQVIAQNRVEYLNFSLICYNKHRFDLQVGDLIYLENIMIKEAPEKTLTDNPPFKDYLTKEGFTSAIFLSHKTLLSVLNRPKTSLLRWIWQQKNKLVTSLKNKLSPLAASYFSLVFLGNKQVEHHHRLRTIFNRWGLAHFLARSGLHIVLFIWMWQSIFRFFPIPLVIKQVLLFFICSMYAALSWASIPFYRAYLLFVFVKIAQLIEKQISFLHLLTLTCMFVLLYNPMQLFFLDFQLTFVLTFTLAWFANHRNNSDKTNYKELCV